MGGWASVHVAARLMVDGKEYELVRTNVTYQLNTIPYASFMVAVGRGHSALTPAAIHKNRFTVQVPVELWVELRPLAGESEDVYPGGEFKLFEGYLTGVSWNKSLQHEHAILHAKNWLLDMDYSSSLSDSSHPLNPSQFSYRASHIIPGSGGISWTPQTGNGFITASTLAQDFWAEGLFKWLFALTQDDLINTVELAHIGQPGKNDTAAKALSRFTTARGHYVPLAMDMEGVDSASAAASVWDDVTRETYDSFANVTLWNKLVGDFATRYMFAVVPRVEDALVVPYIPGLSSIWPGDSDPAIATIKAKDYALMGSSAQLMRLLRGVGVFSGVDDRTGCNGTEPGGAPKRLGIGGWWGPQNVDQGMMMLKQGPRWVTGMIAPDRYSLYSAGAGVEPVGTAMHPGAGAAGGGPPEPKELKKKNKFLLDRFAHSLYVYEQLRLRQLELSGKARFDLCPGSTVSIEVAGDRFIEDNVLTKTLVGDVARITYTIDSETPRISTDFHLAHLRTVDENKIPSYSVPRHPFWKNPWPGAGLLPEAEQ